MCLTYFNKFEKKKDLLSVCLSSSFSHPNLLTSSEFQCSIVLPFQHNLGSRKNSASSFSSGCCNLSRPILIIKLLFVDLRTIVSAVNNSIWCHSEERKYWIQSSLSCTDTLGARKSVRFRTVSTFVTAHTFCASRDTRVSHGWCLQIIQGYF